MLGASSWRAASAALLRKLSHRCHLLSYALHPKPALQAFDELLLLKRGGETIFHGAIGKEASGLRGYLEGLEGVQPMRPGQNPANWMLDETSPDAEAQHGADYAQLYRDSQLAR